VKSKNIKRNKNSKNIKRNKNGESQPFFIVASLRVCA